MGKREDEGRESKIGNREKRDNKEIRVCLEAHFDPSLHRVATGRRATTTPARCIVLQIDVSEMSWHKARGTITELG